MEATTAHAAAQFAAPAVYAPGFAAKFFIAFAVALMGVFAAFLLLMAVGAFSRGGEMALLAIFLVALAGFQALLMRYMWPFLDAVWRLRIEIGAGQASFRLPARTRAPLQPAYAFALPLQQIEKLATRIELIRAMGQVQQMRQFALKANGVWIEYGGVIENSYNGMVGATGKVALSSVAALQQATGLEVEDHGVIEAVRKGEAGTPWGGVSLAAPAADVALVEAGKNAKMWRNILIAAALVIVVVRLLDWFVR
jgi:hypothetical protein